MSAPIVSDLSDMINFLPLTDKENYNEWSKYMDFSVATRVGDHRIVAYSDVGCIFVINTLTRKMIHRRNTFMNGFQGISIHALDYQTVLLHAIHDCSVYCNILISSDSFHTIRTVNIRKVDNSVCSLSITTCLATEKKLFLTEDHRNFGPSVLEIKYPDLPEDYDELILYRTPLDTTAHIISHKENKIYAYFDEFQTINVSENSSLDFVQNVSRVWSKLPNFPDPFRILKSFMTLPSKLVSGKHIVIGWTNEGICWSINIDSGEMEQMHRFDVYTDCDQVVITNPFVDEQYLYVCCNDTANTVKKMVRFPLERVPSLRDLASEELMMNMKDEWRIRLSMSSQSPTSYEKLINAIFTFSFENNRQEHLKDETKSTEKRNADSDNSDFSQKKMKT